MTTTPKEQAPDALRTHFEALASDPSFKLSRSRRGTYVNPAVARDWKWFQLGASRAQQPAPAEATEREFKQFLSDVMTAAGLVTHGNKCKALGDRLAEMCMRLRCPTAQAAPAAGAVAGPTSMPPSVFLNAAGIKADDMPGTVVRKLDAAFHEAVTFADAAPTPAAQADGQPAPVLGYPPLPHELTRTDRGHLIQRFRVEALMRAYVDADRAARKQGGAA